MTLWKKLFENMEIQENGSNQHFPPDQQYFLPFQREFAPFDA